MKNIIQAALLSAAIASPVAMAQTEPTPPAPSVRPTDMQQQLQQEEEFVVKEDGKMMRIKIQDSSGENVDISFSIDEENKDSVPSKILNRLKEKGLLDGNKIEIETEGLEGLEGLKELEKLENLEKLDKDVSLSFHNDIDTDGLHGAAILVPIVGIIAVFGTPILIVYLIVRAATRRKELMHENINKLLESGRDIPPELMQAYQLQNSPEGDLYSGIRLSLVGVAIIISLTALADFDVGSLGFIPLAIGAARVINYKIQEKKKAEASE